MASNPYSRDSSRTWSTRSCVEQFGIYKEAPVKPYNYYKNNSRFIRTGVVVVMLAIVVLLVFLMITDISKTNGAVRSREKDAFLRLLSASQENNNNHTSTPTPTPSTSPSTPSTISTTTPPSTIKTSTPPPRKSEDKHTNHKTLEDYPVHNYNFRDDTEDYDWSDQNEDISPSELADRKLHELQKMKPPPNRRYDDPGHDIHIHIPAGPGYTNQNRGDKPPRPYTPGHRIYKTADGTEHHEISFKDPPAKVAKGHHRDIPLHWGEGYQGVRPPSNGVYPSAPNSVYYPGERGPSNHRRPEYFERPIVVLDGADTKLRSQKRPPATEYYEHRQPGRPTTDYRVYNHHAHNLTDPTLKGGSETKSYPQYWRPYLEDLNHGASKKEPRIVNKNPSLGTATSKPTRKLKTKKSNATRQTSASSKFPQLLNYHYPKDAKNIGDIIKFLNRYEPPQKEDPTPLFDANLGKIMKLKGVYVTHINDDADVDANMSNGHAYNADPFQAYKPDNMADINYLLPSDLRLPTPNNQNLFKNTIRHLNEQKQGGNSKYIPRPPIKYFSNAPMSHQSYNSPVEAYTTAIYHPWSTVAPVATTSTSRPSPMSVMLDVFPLEGGEGKPSRGKRKPFKTIKMNLDKEAAATTTGRKQQMILHLNLYPRKKHNVNSRSDVGGQEPSSFTVNFNSDTHDISPVVKRHYNEDYEGEIRRSDDDYDDEDDYEDDYDLIDSKLNATLHKTDARTGRDSNATYQTEYEREGEEIDFRINVEEHDDDFLFDETTRSPSTKGEAESETVSVENVSEKPPDTERTTERGDRLVAAFPTKSLDRLDSLLGEKSRKYATRESGRLSDYGREKVLSVLNSEVENSQGNNNASQGM